ncbi:BatA domain-containing protein [Myxococcota bacterium]|nr:BatA domain-containing protein [Myxococcota bacterium]
MSFLSPALLIGLLAALIPPLIHLLHRQEIKLHRFPALEFILRSHRKTARRFWLKQWLLILLRSAVLAALALAAARPILARRAEPVVLDGSAPGHAVLILDGGYPMRYQLDGSALFDHARRRAQELLSGARGQVALIVAGDTLEITTERGRVEGALDAARPGFGLGRVDEALPRALELLAEAPPGPRHIIALTTRAAARRLSPPPLPQGVELHLLDSAEGAATPNDGILDLDVRPAPEIGAGLWRVEAQLGHYAAGPAPKTAARLELEGRVVARAFVDLESGGVGRVTFFTRVEGRGPVAARVALEPDALEIDDARDFWLHPTPQIRLLAVNGDPRPTPIDDELFYFERVFAPRATAGLRVPLKIIGVEQLSAAALEGVDVLVLANVRALSLEIGATIKGFVERGGGLLVTMGDNVEPAGLNAALAGVLPRTLRDPRSAGDAAASAEGGDRRAARMSAFHPSHPILDPFDDPRASSLSVASIRRYMLLDPAPDAEGEVVIGLDEGAPLLLTRAVGRGRVALLCTSVDRGWGDLPIHPDFLPLLQRTVRHLTRISGARPAQIIQGQPAPIALDDPRARRAQITAPGGGLFTTPRPETGPWRFAQTQTPGLYEVSVDPPLPDAPQAPGFAVILDPTGSDLEGAALKDDAEGLRPIAAPVAARVELWHALLFGLLLLLLAEGLVLFKRRSS